MLTVYMLCAAVGGTVMVVQFILLVLGFDTDGADIDAGHDAGWFFGVVSIKTLVAGVTFFGLAGIAFDAYGFDQASTLVYALAAGAVALFLMAWLMRSLHRLNAQGNVRVHNAIGQPARVYLTIPGNRAGAGKVTVSLQGRTMEYAAVTGAGDLPTGAAVRVVGIVGGNMLEVAPLAGEAPRNEEEPAV
jgi:membrane protein implicated in regulation of membrane protease activity